MQDRAATWCDRLRMFIFASPKTGNNWLSLLLSTIYQVNQVPVAFEFERLPDGRMDKESTRLKEIPQIDCVGHQHLGPNGAIVDMLKEERIHVLTLLRHPADAFVSLYHYVNKDKERPWKGWVKLLQGRALDHPSVFEFLEKNFFNEFLEKTLRWMATGIVIPVRFEDLKFRPKETLIRVTNRIRPVEESLIDEAVHHCDINNMKKLTEGYKRLCRKGEVGEWKRVLSKAHIKLIERYSEIMNVIGYSLEEESPPENRLREMAIRAAGGPTPL